MNCRAYFWFPFIALLIGHSAIAQWDESNNGIYGGTITALANANGHIFAGTWGGVYHSVNNGIGWEPMNEGLDNTFIQAAAVINNEMVFIATRGGSRMFVASSPYNKWTIANAGLPDDPIVELAVINNQVFGIASNGLLFTSVNGSATWTQIQTSLGPINSISAHQENLFAATDNGIYLSTDRGLNWISKNNGLIEKSIYAISNVNRYVIARSRVGVTFFSDDNGSTWSLASLTGGSFKLVENKNVLYAISEQEAYYSLDEGNDWETVRALPGAKDIVVNGNTLIAGNPYGIYTSTNGAPWTPGNYSRLTNARIVGFASSAEHLFCATGRGDVLRSGDLGKTWTSISKGLPFNEITAIGYLDNQLLIAKADYGLYRSENAGDSWSRAASITKTTSIVKHKNHFFASSNNGVYFSSDKGITWVRLINSPLVGQSLHLFDKQDTLYATSPDYGVSYTSDNGQTWTYINEGLLLPDARPTALIAFQDIMLVGTRNSTPVYTREQLSSPWQKGSEGLSSVHLTTSFATDGRNIFAAGDQGVYTSQTGLDWNSFYNDQLPLFSSPLGVESLIIYRNHLYAGMEAYGVWVSCIPPPRPVITVVGNAPNDSTLVSDSPDGNQWFLNGSPISGANQPTYNPVISGNYAVKVTLNECESELSDEVNVIVIEYPDATIVMPTVFTPNGDAYNPVFVPEQYDYVSYAELQVIDRWGKEIFYTGDLSAGWNGGTTQSGVYYYHIRFIGKNGKQGQVHGWVHLIR
jgi:gliding motility-associated-like protein